MPSGRQVAPGGTILKLMAYDPHDHIPTKRRVLAAWLVCRGIDRPP
jgi:hypothetical protein